MHLSSTPPQEEYRFGNCVLRSDTRELLRDGQVQKVERRSFDLIHYLLRQEGRVVSKDELLEKVWSNRYVTDSVIAQSIMKARKALGISGREEGPIRTVHRVGYRFVGDLRRETRPPSPACQVPQRAMLGVHWRSTEADESLSGQPWLKTGLISLVAHLLRSNGVVVHHDVGDPDPLSAVPAPYSHDPVVVVHTRMRMHQGRYELCWRLQWDTADHEGSAEGGSPVELFLRAAIEVALLVRLRALAVMGVELSAEPWRDFMRLLQLSDNLDTHSRAAPLEALMDQLQSGPPTRFAECLLILALRGEVSTPQRALHLAQSASTRDAHAYAGWAELCLALHALYQPDRERARQHVARAVSLLLLARRGGRVAKGLTLASHVLATLGDLEQAEHTLAHAVQVGSQTMSSSTSAWEDLQAAELGVLRGDIASRGSTFAQAVGSCQKLGLEALTAFALVFHALHHLSRGDVGIARQQLQSAQWISDRGGWPRARIFANLHLGLLCARLEDREELQRCLSRLEERPLADTWLGAAALKWLRARVCMLVFDVDAALPLLEEARQALGGLGIWWQEDAWVFLGQVQLMAGHRSRAQALLTELQARCLGNDKPMPRATALALEALLARFDGRTPLATALLERARSLATGSVLEPALSALLSNWRHGSPDTAWHGQRHVPAPWTLPDPERAAAAPPLLPQDRADTTWRSPTV